MWLFRKLFGTHEHDRQGLSQVPAWAPFFDAMDYRFFLETICAYFDRSGVAYELGDGVVKLASDERLLGLQNLAQLCHLHEPDEWPGLVSEHFEQMALIDRENRQFEDIMDDFAMVSDSLAVRLWPEDVLESTEHKRLVFREDLPGVVSALVFDLPHCVRQVITEVALEWGKPLDELYRVALDNVFRASRPVLSFQNIGDDLQVALFTGDSFFVATHALMLHAHPDMLGAHGALVGVPHRHALLVFPVDDTRAVEAMPMLMAVVNGMYNEGPGSISPRLYWYRNGTFIDIPYELDDNKCSITPPPSVIAMLNDLAEPPER